MTDPSCSKGMQPVAPAAIDALPVPAPKLLVSCTEAVEPLVLCQLTVPQQMTGSAPELLGLIARVTLPIAVAVAVAAVTVPVFWYEASPTP